MKRATILSPLEGEMAAKQPEGVLSEGTTNRSSTAARTPPDRFAATLPSRGRDPCPTSHRRSSSGSATVAERPIA